MLYCHQVFHLAKSLPNCTGLNRLGEYKAGRIQNVKEQWNFCQTGRREAPKKMMKRISVNIDNATHGCEMWTSPVLLQCLAFKYAVRGSDHERRWKMIFYVTLWSDHVWSRQCSPLWTAFALPPDRYSSDDVHVCSYSVLQNSCVCGLS